MPVFCGLAETRRGPLYRNRETAHHTRARAITVLVTLAQRENSSRNREPKADHSRVKAKPMKASSTAKPASGSACPW